MAGSSYLDGSSGRGKKGPPEGSKPCRKLGADVDFAQICSHSLDIFKGVLVVFMTFAHVDLCLMSPYLQYFSAVPHFVGNVAAGLCFLGFMLAYGFVCDAAYLADARQRTLAEQWARVGRSALLPVAGAWVCSFAWALICFKMPIDLPTVVSILTFRLSVGNGPDFLLCFPICLLVMFALRPYINRELASHSAWRNCLCALVMVLAPLLLTACVISDCTGTRKYFNYFLECYNREAWSPNLAALPHLFYFNLGVLLSRGSRAFSCVLKVDPDSVSWRGAAATHAALTVALGLLSYPLLSVWAASYGNLYVTTPWGTIARGFSGGPSPWWLVGNLLGVETLLIFCIGLHFAAEHTRVPVFTALLRLVVAELEHLGANVLLYLVVADICLAGLYRGAQGQFPLSTCGGAATTLGLIMVTRFLFYLSASSRTTGARGTKSAA